ncbi:unnamed protein product [Moneuplotes crassus]|uniref:Uncharacterized protein n=1 Tax=Euplotes crassus TaxID=5936 RepID=A0AAD1Y609_EUPCR|nr:unnamed protein product [Moneuplotes crassus]
MRINTKNCITYILENSNLNKIQIDTSTERDASISNILTGSELSIKAHAGSSTVQCSLEVKIPGGQSLTELYLKFPGETRQNHILYDYKDNSSWSSPLIITNFSIDVDAANPNIFLRNEHEVAYMRITGAYCVCDFQKLKIKAMNFEIMFGSLNIVQNKFYAENKITVKTPHGTHCVAGHIVNNVDTSCPDQATRDAGISSTFIDTSSYCHSELYVCSNSSSSCPISGTTASSNQGDFKLTLNDGPVQFIIDASSAKSTSTYLPKFDTFAVTSQNQLRENKESFSGDQKDPRMYIYELSSPSFSQTWIHLFLKQYLQARVWLISILSLNFLTPSTYRYTLIHIPNATCPSAASGSLISSTYISKKLKELSFIEAKHVIAQLTQDGYYSYELTEDNRFEKEPIRLWDNSVLVIISVLMVVYWTVGIILVFWLVALFETSLEKRYHKILQQARIFSQSKRRHLKDGYGFKSVNQENNKVKVTTKVLRIGCFTSEVEEIDQVLKKSYEHTYQLSKEDEPIVQLSFFKTFSLIVDSYFRKRRNSFKDFLNHITVDECYFKEKMENNPEDMTMVSIRLDLLHSHYLDFCTKYGLTERIMSEEETVLANFNLQIQSIESSSTSAYTKIRWKTFFEKEKQEKSKNKGANFAQPNGTNTYPEVSLSGEINARRNFVVQNCTASRYETDYILQEELLERFKDYCDDNKIDPVKAGNILACKELTQFGAVYKEDFKIPHMIGITESVVDMISINVETNRNAHQVQYLPGLIRAKESYTSLLDIPIIGGGTYRMLEINSSRASFSRNLFQILFCLAFIFGFPLCFQLIVIWALQQVDKVKSDIYAPTFGLSDVFSASSTDHWFNYLEFYWIFYAFLSLALLFILSGLAEFICFIATDGSDTGRYSVIKTIPRWIISTIFWCMLYLYIGMYVAYFGVVLLWCILGAILNPHTFLPLASAAGVIIGCAAYFATVLRKANSSLDEIVNKIIEEQLQIAIINSLNGNEVISKIVKSVDNLPQTAFHTALNSFMYLNNLEKVERSISDKILDGDIQSLTLMLESNFMIPAEVSKGIIGMLIDDPLLINSSIQSYAYKKRIKDPLLIDIVDFIYFITTTYHKNKSETSKKVSQIMMKMVEKISPSFNLEIIDFIVQMAFERRLDPLKKILEEEIVLPEVINIAIAIRDNDKAQVQTNLTKLAQRFFPTKLYHLFYALNNLTTKNIYDNDLYLEDIFSVSPCISVELIFCLFNEDEETVRHTMLEGIQKFCERKDPPIKGKLIQSLYLSLSSMINSDKVDLPSLIRKSLIPIDENQVELLYKTTQGDQEAISYICDHLRIRKEYNIIFEIATTLFHGKLNFKEICKKLEVPLEPIKQIEQSIKTQSQLLGKYQNIDQTITLISNEFKAIKDCLDKIASTTNKLTNEDFDKKLNAHKLRELVQSLRNFIKLYTDNILDKITPNKAKKDAIRSLVNILNFFGFCYDRELMYRSCDTETYSNSINTFAFFVGIDSEKLHFIVDLFTKDPARIFRFEDPNPDIDPRMLTFQCRISRTRLKMISEVFDISLENVKKIAALWTYSQNLMHFDTYQEDFNGDNQKFMSILTKDVLRVDENFFNLLTGLKSLSESEVDRCLVMSQCRDFLSTLIIKLSSMFSSTSSEIFDENQIDLENNIWPWEESHQNSFLYSYKSFYVKLSDSTIAELNQYTDLSIKEVSSLFESMNLLCRLLSDPNSFSLKEISKPSSNDLFLQKLMTTFDEKHIDCVLTLTMIHHFKDELSKFENKHTKNIFIPAAVLFNQNNLKELAVQNSILRSLIKGVPEFLQSQKVQENLNLSAEDLYRHLFEAGFFDQLCAHLFTNDSERLVVNIDQKKLIQLWIDLNCDYRNKDQIISNFLQLGKTGNHNELKVLYSIVRKDLGYEKLLQNFLEDIDVPPKLGLSLIKILEPDNPSGYFKAAYNLLNNRCISPHTIAALLSCFKRDCTSINFLTDQLELDPKLSAMVFSLALKDSKVDFSLLSKLLNTDKIKLVETITRIACGETDILLKLAPNNQTLKEPRYIVSHTTHELIGSILILLQEYAKTQRNPKGLNLKAVLKSSFIISANILNSLKPKSDNPRDEGSFGSNQNKHQEDEKYEEQKRFRGEFQNSDLFEGGSKTSSNKIHPSPSSSANNNPTEENKENDRRDEGSEESAPDPDLPEFHPLNQSEQHLKGTNSLPEIVQRLILFSLGDTFATEDIFETLKIHYKRQSRYKTDFSYTIEDCKKFPQMMRDRKLNKVCLIHKKKNLTLNSFLKYKDQINQQTVTSILRCTNRVNSYTKIINQDIIYTYLLNLWSQEKNTLSSGHIIDSEISKINEEILETIRGHRLSPLHCSFVSYTNRPIVGAYYECTLSSGYRVDLCLLCAHKCQFSTVENKTPKEGPHVCACGKNNNLIEKVRGVLSLIYVDS